MNSKARLLTAIVFGCGAIMYVAPGPTAAIDIDWYEQAEPGHAAGVIRLGGLVDGVLEISTPGRRMEFGIRRTGDVAIVRITELPGRSAPDGDARQELVVVARQGTVNTRAIYQLAMPEPVEPEPLPVSAAPPPGPATRPGPSAASAEEPQAPPATDQHAATELAVATTALPAEPEVSKPVCPELVVTRGSLHSTAARLLAQCGHVLGEWLPGNDDTIVDFEVEQSRIVSNDAGIDGLLALLREYGLVGVIHPVTGAVDIHEL